MLDRSTRVGGAICPSGKTPTFRAAVIPMSTSTSSEIELQPVPFQDVIKEEIVDLIAKTQGKRPVSFLGVNAHTVYLAERDPEFREILAETYRFCDGFGLHLLAVLQGLPKPRNRNTPTDFMWDVFARLHGEGKTVYLVGDEPGVAEKFASLVEQRYSGLVCGFHHGFFQADSEEERAIVAAIEASGAHLLCVGMGQPRQEKWVHRLRAALRVSAVFYIGASMAFAIGARKRGPAWATGRGLEWLFRVLHEPRKMFSRYFVEIPWLMVRSISRR